jgi:hypothetical protein
MQPSLESLYAAMPELGPTPQYRPVTPGDVSEPYASLLVHDRHMTVAMEEYHDDKVEVKVLRRHQTGDSYIRQILLITRKTKLVVQGGIVRIDLSQLADPVRAKILEERTPLGHVLIQNDVLRHIDVTSYIELAPGFAQHSWPGFLPTTPVFGRLGILYCNHQPAIELFEVIPQYR